MLNKEWYIKTSFGIYRTILKDEKGWAKLGYKIFEEEKRVVLKKRK